MRKPMGGMPGMVPGQIAFGHISAFAGAPSMTGGIFNIEASSVGNLKPASLNALPKSFSLGKSRWQVAQLVPYWRANAGIAWVLSDKPSRTARRAEDTAKALTRRGGFLRMSMSPVLSLNKTALAPG